VHPSFTSISQQQSTLSLSKTAAMDNGNLYYCVSYTRARKPRLICNVDDGYRALQIKHETNLATSTSHLQHKTSAAEQQSKSANIDDRAINLLVTTYAIMVLSGHHISRPSTMHCQSADNQPY
jgi:hypothetical protein